MGSSQVNLSGFNVGENNTFTGNRLTGEPRKIILGIIESEKKDRDARLKSHFENKENLVRSNMCSD